MKATKGQIIVICKDAFLRKTKYTTKKEDKICVRREPNLVKICAAPQTWPNLCFILSIFAHLLEATVFTLTECRHLHPQIATGMSLDTVHVGSVDLADCDNCLYKVVNH